MNTNIYETKRVYGDENMLNSKSSNRLEKMLEMAKSIKKSPENILDIGCGTGYFAHLLKTMYPNANVFGVDISERALTIGRKKYKNISLLNADAEVKLPFKNNTFDLVISGEYIEHIKDVDTNLLEINRVLKKGGTLIITTPNLAYWMNRILLLFGRQPWYLDPSLRKTLPIFKIGDFTFPENLNNPPAGHLRLYTLDMLKKLLNIYGYKTIEVKGSKMLRKIVFKQIDQLISNFPNLAFGLITKAVKSTSL